jgi:hypothetical protein
MAMSVSYSVGTCERWRSAAAGATGRRQTSAPGNDFHRTANPFAPEGIPATPESDESEPS